MPVHSVAIAQIYSVYAIQRHCGPIVSWGRFALSTEADWMFKEAGLAFNLAWARKCAVPREDHIFSKSDFKGLCAWKKKERKKENSLTHYDFIYLLFMFSITLFFFCRSAILFIAFLVFGTRSYAMYQVEKFVSLVRKSSRSLYYFKEDVLESLLDLCDAVRIVNRVRLFPLLRSLLW